MLCLTSKRRGRLGGIGGFVNVGWHNELCGLLRRVPPWRFFRLGRVLGGLPVRLHPFGVENARLVDPLVGVGAEEIALRLEQIGGKPRLAVAVEIA